MASSYEHDESGFSSESFPMRSKMVNKRARKMESILKDMPKPAVYGDKKADVTIVGWGSLKLPMLDALPMLQAQGIKARFVHFNHIFPS